jgi:hypothetical protein
MFEHFFNEAKLSEDHYQFRNLSDGSIEEQIYYQAGVTAEILETKEGQRDVDKNIKLTQGEIITIIKKLYNADQLDM